MDVTPSAPAGLAEFWDQLDQDLARYPAAAELEHLPLRSSDLFTVSWVKLTSIGPYRIGGYLSVPTGDGPFPALMQTPRYGSVNHVPDYNDRLRYVVLTIMHRGQRLVDQPFPASYPGLLTHGIASPDNYIYRGIVADCLRGAEYLLDYAKVDRGRVAISGDDLALLTAARRPGFSAIQASGLMFYRLDEARKRSQAYPIEEVNDYVRANPEHEADVASTLSYFDPRHQASTIQGNTLLSVNDPGTLGGPEWLEPLVGALGGRVEQYALTHRGGNDNDWIDAWLAGRLGREAMSRFRHSPV